MTRHEHLLTTLAKECGKVLEELGDSKDFSKLESINDLYGVLFLLADEGTLNMNSLESLDSLGDFFTDFRKLSFNKMILIFQSSIHRALLFGLQEIKPNSTLTNEQQILSLQSFILATFGTEFKYLNPEKIVEKKKKVLLWMEKTNIQKDGVCNEKCSSCKFDKEYNSQCSKEVVRPQRLHFYTSSDSSLGVGYNSVFNFAKEYFKNYKK